ncbi:hypothetical protein KV557_24875 [Kitasatospora aureofaciens]|uniref:hypothetical protein n=1 Tax=Kitasatospora aureofaciens TaxID=1894 RepID=UPI001C460419|nr:hypothetical protein [Kitasatospora aureofaciens]MBV6700300.1 hypothetical protein [Kitasatospora aureofaciens]
MHGPEPVAEAASEAATTATMAVRLILMIADAVRRDAEKKAGKEESKLPPADVAVPEAAGELKTVMPPDITMALMSGADWPQMAQQLVALRRAGVDLGELLPRVGEIAVSVRDAVAANASRIAAEGNEEWASLLRETMPAGPVREAILSSPGWPEIAQTMRQLHERGVDVRQILVAAHAEGAGVDQAVARVMETGKAPVVAPSRDAKRSWGPLTTGLDIPKDLDLSNRGKALAQVGVSASENARFVRMVQEAMPGKEREAALLVNARQWPLLAARMAKMEDEGLKPGDHLPRLMRDQEWAKGSASDLVPRLVQATNAALLKPTGEEVAAGGVVPAAAKAGSVTMGPTKTPAKSAAPTTPAVAPHRAPGPAPTAARKR